VPQVAKSVNETKRENMKTKRHLGICGLVAFSLLVGSFVQAQIIDSSLVLHLKADAGVILNGLTVSKWQDQSGYGKDVSNSTVYQQPLWVANAINGKPALRFANALSQHLFSSATLDLSTGGFSFFAVMAANVTNGPGRNSGFFRIASTYAGD
jgi:hypothetical protein